jgi:hypothetical protein
MVHGEKVEKRIGRDHQAVSMAIVLIMTVVAAVGAIAIGLMVLSYEGSSLSGDFSYDLDLGPVTRDGSTEGKYFMSIDSTMGEPYSTYDIVLNNHTSDGPLADMIGNESAWHVDGVRIYIDDANANGNCDRGDRLVVVIDQPENGKVVDISIRNTKFGMELSSVRFVDEDDVD